MKSVISYPVKVFATGFIVLVFLSLILFQIRKSCESSFSFNKPDDLTIRRAPSGLVPDEFENDPNVITHSNVSTFIQKSERLSLGIYDYFQARVPGGRLSNVYFFDSEDDCMYFDKKSGLIVHHYHGIQEMPDKRTTIKKEIFYVGPDGISETQDKSLGRFIEPIIELDWNYRVQRNRRELIVYDKKLRQFFKIDFDKANVIKGPELVKKVVRHNPVQIGRLNKSRMLYLGWEPPKEVKKSEGGSGGPEYIYPGGGPVPIIPTQQARQSGPYILVLDKSGRIDLLDRESLEFVSKFEFSGGAGRLFNPESYIGPRSSSARPKDLLDYDVLLLYLTTHFYEGNPETKKVFFGEPLLPVDPSPMRIERKYLGMFVASLSRSGTGLALKIWNDEGREITKPESVQQEQGPRTISHRTSRVVYLRPSWESIFTVGKYLAEELHPPVLSLASYYTARNFDAAAGHRALFFLPNSFIAMWGGHKSENFVLRFLVALWWLMPSIILSIWLSTRITKDAVVVGLSKNVRLYWVIGTLAFGLVAYITYRLTRPKIILVTCQNCGRMRRPDMDRCHRCKSEWFVPELTPPAWRVLDGAENVAQIEIADEGLIAGAENEEGSGDVEGTVEEETE